MARPQSPELRRSGTTPAFEPDNIASRLEARDRPTSKGGSGPVPEENEPGHHPDHDQDQPDLDAFAARFSGSDLDDLPTDTGVVDDRAPDGDAADDRTASGHSLTRWVAPVAGLAVLAAVVAFLLRRRRA
jgi:hypothetical protein